MTIADSSLKLHVSSANRTRDAGQIRLARIVESAHCMAKTPPWRRESSTVTVRICQRMCAFLSELQEQISDSILTAQDARSHAVVLTLAAAEESLSRIDPELHEAIQVTAQSCLNFARFLDETDSRDADQNVIQFCIAQLDAVIDFLGRGERKVTPSRSNLQRSHELIA